MHPFKAIVNHISTSMYDSARDNLKLKEDRTVNCEPIRLNRNLGKYTRVPFNIDVESFVKQDPLPHGANNSTLKIRRS